MDKEFWKLVGALKYPIFKYCALKLKIFFELANLGEATFSSMQFTKNKYRSYLTDESLKLAVSNYCPDLEKLSRNIGPFFSLTNNNFSCIKY